MENADSDLDILVTTFDRLFERIRFYQLLEAKLKLIDGVEHFIAVKTANIPLAKFTLNGVKFDLVFADMQTPHQIYRDVADANPTFEMTPDYLLLEENVGIGNMKSAECLNSYLSVLRLKKFVEKLMPQ